MDKESLFDYFDSILMNISLQDKEDIDNASVLYINSTNKHKAIKSLMIQHNKSFNAIRFTLIKAKIY